MDGRQAPAGPEPTEKVRDAMATDLDTDPSILPYPLPRPRPTIKYKVNLEEVMPAKASGVLKAYIKMGQHALQLAVDLLGMGARDLPPVVALMTQGIDAEAFTAGEASTKYKTLVKTVEERQVTMDGLDEKVASVSSTVCGNHDSSVRQIIQIVEGLKDTLRAVGAKKLKAADESKLMQAVIDAVKRAYGLVESALEKNLDLSGDNGRAVPAKHVAYDSATNPNVSQAAQTGQTGQQQGQQGQQGDGGQGMAQIMQLLATLPMSLMPMVQQLMKQNEKGKDDKPVSEGTDPAMAAGIPAGEPVTPIKTTSGESDAALLRPVALTSGRRDDRKGNFKHGENTADADAQNPDFIPLPVPHDA